MTDQIPTHEMRAAMRVLGALEERFEERGDVMRAEEVEEVRDYLKDWYHEQ